MGHIVENVRSINRGDALTGHPLRPNVMEDVRERVNAFNGGRELHPIMHELERNRNKHSR